MPEEIVKVEEPLVFSGVGLAASPKVVLEQAKEAAEALTKVIAGKKRKVILNGEQYLEFEDWQTLGRFYGYTVGVRETHPVEFDGAKGYEASAYVNNRDGMIVSSADAMCLDNEQNWGRKPAFQLRSMAQTRACAKALRNVLAWVVVLAGYRPTPAEEMTMGDAAEQKQAATPSPKPASAPKAPVAPAKGTEKGDGTILGHEPGRRTIEVVGVKHREKPTETGKKIWRDIHVLDKGKETVIACWDSSLFDAAGKMLDQTCVVTVSEEPGKGKNSGKLFYSLKAIWRIGPTEYDGQVPVIQRQEHITDEDVAGVGHETEVF